MSDLAASIIVCTRNRADLLADALRSILADRSEAPREVLVVDNASTDHTPEVIHSFERSTGPIPVRGLFESRVGKSHALNRAVVDAGGDILLFTDDDVLVEDGWADALLSPFAEGRVGAAGGRVLPVWPHSPPDWLVGDNADPIAMHDWGPEAMEFPSTHVPSANNMGIRGTALLGMDPPFDPDLGVTGSRYVAGEDTLLLFEIQRKWRILYTPEALVRHRISADRMTWPAMTQQFFGTGIGHARIDRKRRAGAWRPLPMRMYRLAKASVNAVRRELVRGRREPSSPQEAYRRLWGYLWLGYGLESVFGRFPWLASRVEARLWPFPSTAGTAPAA